MLLRDVELNFALENNEKRWGGVSRKGGLRSFFVFLGDFGAFFWPNFFQTPWVIE